MLVFYWYDSLVQSHWINLQPSDGKFYLVLVRFVVAGGTATGLAFLSRRFFEEKFLRMKDQLAC
jgi:hypothetical protein